MRRCIRCHPKSSNHGMYPCVINARCREFSLPSLLSISRRCRNGKRQKSLMLANTSRQGNVNLCNICSWTPAIPIRPCTMSRVNRLVSIISLIIIISRSRRCSCSRERCMSLFQWSSINSSSSSSGISDCQHVAESTHIFSYNKISNHRQLHPLEHQRDQHNW